MDDGEQPNKTNHGISRQLIAIVLGGCVMLVAAGFIVFQMGKNTVGKSQQSRDVWSYLPVNSGIPPVVVASPTPLFGPGPFACDPFGICNMYDESTRAGCPKTFADRSCLNECEKKDVRCKK